MAVDWKEVADILVEAVKKSPSHEQVREAALKYVKDRRGGTMRACRLIAEFLNNT